VAEKVGFYNEAGDPGIRYQLQIFNKNDKYNKRGKAAEKVKTTEKVTGMKQITWGESHCVMLDKKGRLFTMGASLNGRLGLSDNEIAEVIKFPT